jgi:hypothetical protein
VAAFPDGQFQALFAAVVGDLSTAATAAAESAAIGSSGSVAVTNPNFSSATKTSPGAGGSSTTLGGSGGSTPLGASGNTTTGLSRGVFALTSPSTGNSGTPGSVGNTAANPVSATR